MARFTADVPIVFDMHVATARQSCLAGTARLTRQAPKFMPHMCLPAFFRSDPMVSNPRRIMPNVLLMAALKVSDPVQLFVLMEPDDSSWLSVLTL
jgi:hypothetical protein